MKDADFFAVARTQSLVKAEVVSKYFSGWATAILQNMNKNLYDHIVYMDLFCGPGRYKDGNESTPIKLIRRVIQSDQLRDSVQLLFNDLDADHIDNLKAEIKAFPDIQTLRFQPKTGNFEVGPQFVAALKQTSKAPTLLFADPCGYKGLSLDLISSVLPNWGCDCILFFNYNRINAALDNPVFEESMIDLFGMHHYELLKADLPGLDPDAREVTVIEHISEALRDLGGQYVLPMRFVMDKTTKISHHLIFVSKNVLGYKIMKEIMAKSASSDVPGLGCFEYNPATEKQPILFGYSLRRDDLKSRLPRDFAGMTLKMKDVYFQHNIGTPFIKEDYKAVLTDLEEVGIVSTVPSAVEWQTYICRLRDGHISAEDIGHGYQIIN